MNMKPNNPVPASGSLIERAAQVYDFGALLGPESPFLAPKPAAAPVAPPVLAPIATPVVSAPAAYAPASAPVAAPAAPVAHVPEQVAPAPAPMAAPVAPPVQGWTGVRPKANIDMAALQTAGFIQPGAPPNLLSEEFRLVKRQLMLSAFGGRSVSTLERGRAILVCSAQPNEGKTFSSVNLALSLANERDIEVVLVDADVAKPEVLSTLGMEGGAGLMDALSDPSLNVESLIIETSVPKLFVLPAGRQANNDTELLAAARTQAVIDAMLATNPARIVIFDTAPLLAASPASVLAHHVGQILMVVRADHTGESELRDAISMLDGPAQIQLLLNGVSYAGTTQKFGSYYGYGG
jgi:exopolysaccharide/PEP-CTERM locus tyrosine autokinase